MGFFLWHKPSIGGFLPSACSNDLAIQAYSFPNAQVPWAKAAQVQHGRIHRWQCCCSMLLLLCCAKVDIFFFIFLDMLMLIRTRICQFFPQNWGLYNEESTSTTASSECMDRMDLNEGWQRSASCDGSGFFAPYFLRFCPAWSSRFVLGCLGAIQY